MWICFATLEFTVEDSNLFTSSNIDAVESLALSSEEKPQTHSGKLRDAGPTSSQQDYQV